jgi:molybdopterin-containing oxidoreductase family membrane subunit
MASYKWSARPLGDAILYRLKNLLGVFIASVLYFVLVYHLTNLYITENHGIERFILLDGGVYTWLFWTVQVGIGSLLPLALLYYPATGRSRGWIGISSALVIIGGLAQMYIIIIGGQAYPLDIFPGKVFSSSFFDGVVNSYTPSLPEVTLGLGGVALALAAVLVGIRVLRFLPTSLEDELVDPHYSAEKAPA